MKLSGYPSTEYFFYSQNQKKMHIFTWWHEMGKGFGLCGADIGFSGEDDFPDDLFDIVGSDFPDEKICAKCLKIYKSHFLDKTVRSKLPMESHDKKGNI